MADSDALEKAREALQAVRQYQQAWQQLGVNRVYQYFSEVNGDWLENFESIELHTEQSDRDDL